jgi:NAD(P)-dependent dehydrogenase (short-subunit alcohol dehydrogenase family)
MSLEGKRILIIGGTSGIGFATAKAAAREGATVIVASSSQARVDRAREALPGSAEGYIVDLRSEESIKSLFERVGDYDHLVYTAGESLKTAELKDFTLQQAQGFFAIRYWGAFLAVKHGNARIRPGGSIVLSSGMASRRPRKAWTVVSSICGAMESFAKACAVELAPLRVNVVCPGLVKTDMWDNLPEDARAAMFKRAEQNLPVGHPGEPDEVAEAYLYFMRAGFTTGSVAIVDGGAAVG